MSVRPDLVACWLFRIVEDRPEILLIHRSPGRLYPGLWQCVTGKLEPGERIVEAALREVAEETGLTGARVVRRLGVSDRPHPDTAAPQHTTYVLLRYDGRSDQHAEPWTWKVEGAGEDGGLLFRCWFTPLPLDRVELAGHQSEFLASVLA